MDAISCDLDFRGMDGWDQLKMERALRPKKSVILSELEQFIILLSIVGRRWLLGEYGAQWWFVLENYII